MKYIILPILKFLWVITLTIISTVVMSIMCIWTMKFIFIKSYDEYYITDISPYDNVKYSDYPETFKSYYHYIGGIR